MTEEEAPPNAAPEPPRTSRMPSERQADTLNGLGEVIAKAMEGLEATVDCINRASYETSGLRRFKYLMRAKSLGTAAGATITSVIGRLDPEAFVAVEAAEAPGSYGRISRILSHRRIEDMSAIEPRASLPAWGHGVSHE